MGGNQLEDHSRAHRARVHAEVKRYNAVANIRKVFELSTRVDSTPEVVPKFLKLAKSVDEYYG